MNGRKRFARAQKVPILTAIVSIIVLIVVLQLWLFTATMNAYLGGDHAAAPPAAVASTVCFALILGLLRYVYRLDR